MADEQIPTSLHCRPNELLKVRFINCCDKSVQILWATYDGGYQLYATLRARQFLDVNTYLRHAWVFKEEETGRRVMANNKPYFYGAEFPQMNQESRSGMRFGVVMSKACVVKLEKICVTFISRYLKKCTDVKYLEIPIILKKRLVKEMHLLDPSSHSTKNDLKTCEKNLHDFTRVS